MRIRYYLKRPESKTETSIFALVNYSGNQLKIYTGECILPKNWNPETQSARNTPKFPEHPEFNERLTQIKARINRTYLEYRNTNDGTAPSPAILKPLVEAALKRGGGKVTLPEYFEDFITRTKAGQRINPKSKLPIRSTGVKGYETTLNHLKAFAKTWKRKLDFETIDLEFHHDFTTYLTGAPALLSANTVGSHIQRIKAVLSEATERGHNANTAFKSRYFVKQSEDADTIYLSESELDEIKNFDLSNDTRLERVRDLFLIGCFTGLRFSDFSTIRKENIKDGLIRITQQKTGAPVTIPIRKAVAEVFEKYNGEIPRSISNEKMNAYLKELGKEIKCLQVVESKAITKGGAKVISNKPKWELLTTHTARRSFATNEYKAGTPTLTIMAITGHKTEKSFLKYIRVTNEEHAKNISILWAERDAKSKLKAV